MRVKDNLLFAFRIAMYAGGPSRHKRKCGCNFRPSPAEGSVSNLRNRKRKHKFVYAIAIYLVMNFGSVTVSLQSPTSINVMCDNI